MKAPTYEDIKPYLEKKLINEQVHPENKDVRIFNYSHTVQFSGEWDEVTKTCRGLILNIKTGEVLARPFTKFFNYSEHIDKNWPIPTEDPIITEKFDGSLGIMYTLNDLVWIATRGSFTSEQAMWATAWWREHKGDEPYGNERTYLFEILYPKNRIVVNYDFSGLVYLGALETATGKQIKDVIMPVKSVETTSASVEDLLQLEKENAEGFVLYYPKADVRMKIKFPEYVRLHKIITGLSEIGVWEQLRAGKNTNDLAKDVPDEFYKWIKHVEGSLVNRFNSIKSSAETQFADGASEEIYKNRPQDEEAPRREWAEMIKKMDHPAIGFALLDNKSIKEIIWKMIRPKGKSTFKTDLDL